MKFVELSSSEFEKASNNFPGSSFYQSYAWTKIKELTGWKHYFVGVLRDNKLVAISLIIGKKVYFDKYLYYAPRGVLLDYNDTELLSFFTKEIKKFLIKKKGVVLKIDPFIEYQKHDNYGNVIGDFCNRQVINIMVLLRVIRTRYNLDGVIIWILIEV